MKLKTSIAVVIGEINPQGWIYMVDIQVTGIHVDFTDTTFVMSTYL